MQTHILGALMSFDMATDIRQHMLASEYERYSKILERYNWQYIVLSLIYTICTS